MASATLNEPSLTKPRLWVVTNADYTHDVHETTGLCSMLAQKRSTMELYGKSDATATFSSFQRTTSMSSSHSHASSPPPIPGRCPSRKHILRRDQTIRRKRSPTLETLRQIREKESEMQLQRLYEAQTLAYLTDSLPSSRRSSLAGYSIWSSSEDEDGEDEEPEFVLAPEY